MNIPNPRKRTRAPAARALSLVFALVLLAGAILVPLPAAAQDDTGASDPAIGFGEWPDDEWFVARPIQGTGVQRLSVYEAGSDFQSQTEEDTYDLAAGSGHDAVAVAAGHFLTATHESVLYAFRLGVSEIGLRFFRPTTTEPVIQLGTLVARYVGGTDFIDLAAGDMDGEPGADGDYRDEAIVAWANPGSGGKHPVSVAVLAFGGATEAAPEPTGMTSNTSSSSIDGASLSNTTIRRVDNALSLAVGDFNGDGVDEAAVAYLSGPSALTIDIFRYEVTRSGFDFVRTLSRVGGTTVTLAAGTVWNESISLAAGDFDGDMSQQRWGDDLALATSERTIVSTTHTQNVRLRMFNVTCADYANCSTSPNLTVIPYSVPSTLGAPITDSGGGIARKVQIVAGLFKLDPLNLNRRQIAAAYTITSGVGREGRVRIVDLNSALGATLGSEAAMGIVNTETFWLASGGFQGARSGNDPIWSLMWSSWVPGDYTHKYMRVNAFPAAPSVASSWGSPGVYGLPTQGARAPIVAVDSDGDTMYLGSPVHIILYDVVNLDFILQEPPKHAIWDPVAKIVTSVSRTDKFNITLKQSDTSAFGTKSTDTSDWSIGGSATASASVTVKANASAVIASTSQEASIGASATVGYDYQQHESEYNENNEERTVSFTGETSQDDLLVGRLQALHIWRYRLYGMELSDPNVNPFYEIVIPDSGTQLNTETGGLNFDWYQPTHENGNVLSYPQFVDGQTFNPPDRGSYTIPCTPGSPGCVDGKKTVTELLFPPAVYFCDGNTGGRALEFSAASGGGTERSSSHTLAENASVNASYKSEVKIGGKRNNVSMGTEFSASAEFHNSNSWGSSSSSNFKTTSATGITLNRAGCSSLNAYAYFPIIYQATDGSIKAMFATDPLGSPGGKQWWIDHYGQKPDLALNLPWRFYYSTGTSQSGVPNWQVTSSALRKQLRGFFVRENTANPATGVYDNYSGAVADGETTRLEVRVYNYSVTQGVAAGKQVKFEGIAYDPSTNRESGSRFLIGTATLPAMAARQMVTAAVNWNTTDKSGGTTQQYRVYVTLDPANTLAETYEIESQATQFYFTTDPNQYGGGFWTSCASLTPEEYAAKNCVDPAQNNEGYGYVTVAKTPTSSYIGQREDTDLSMDAQSLAVLGGDGNPLAEPVPAQRGMPLEVRVVVHTDTPGTQTANVLLFDGDPQAGGVLGAGKSVFVGSIADAGNPAWFTWVPQTYGTHTLYAVVQESLGDKQPNNNSDSMQVVVAPPSVFLPVVNKAADK